MRVGLPLHSTLHSNLRAGEYVGTKGLGFIETSKAPPLEDHGA